MLYNFSATYCDVTEDTLVEFVLNLVEKVFKAAPEENILGEEEDIIGKLFDFVRLTVF